MKKNGHLNIPAYYVSDDSSQLELWLYPIHTGGKTEND